MAEAEDRRLAEAPPPNLGPAAGRLAALPAVIRFDPPADLSGGVRIATRFLGRERRRNQDPFTELARLPACSGDWSKFLSYWHAAGRGVLLDKAPRAEAETLLGELADWRGIAGEDVPIVEEGSDPAAADFILHAHGDAGDLLAALAPRPRRRLLAAEVAV